MADKITQGKASPFALPTRATNPYITSDVSDGYRETNILCILDGSLNLSTAMPTGTGDTLIYTGFPKPLKNVFNVYVSPFGYGAISVKIDTNGNMYMSNNSGTNAYGIYRALMAYFKA